MSSISEYIKYQGKYLLYQITPTNKVKIINTSNKKNDLINILNNEYKNYKGYFVIAKINIEHKNTKAVISVLLNLYVNNNGSYINFDDIEDDNLFNQYEPLSRLINNIIYFGNDFILKYGWTYKYVTDIINKSINGLELLKIKNPYYEKHILNTIPKVQKMKLEPIIKPKKERKNKIINPLNKIKREIKDYGLVYAYKVVNNKATLLFVDNKVRKIKNDIIEKYNKEPNNDLIILSRIKFWKKDSGFPSEISVYNTFYLFNDKNKLLSIERFKNRKYRQYFNNYEENIRKLGLSIFYNISDIINNNWNSDFITNPLNKLLKKDYVANKKIGWHIYNKL